jgi:hypothetical protein
MVFPDGAPILLVSLSRRVAGWIGETAKVGEIICTPAIGNSAAALIGGRIGGAATIGIVEMSRLPGGIGLPLKAGLPDATLKDASALFRQCRHPADAAERALSGRAAAIAGAAFDRLRDTSPATSGAAIESLEGSCRLAGAEDVLVLIAPDLTRDSTLRRMEGSVALGRRYGIRLSVAYKGHWVRSQQNCFTAGVEESVTADAIDAWLCEAVPRLGNGAAGLAALTANGRAPDGLTLRHGVAEACVGCAPLAEVSDLPAGAVVSLTMCIEDREGGFWLAGEPVLLADVAGQPALRLAAAAPGG